MPLERELKIIQDYMYLQKMRFGQRVRYDTDCAPETLEVLVPPLFCSLWWKTQLNMGFLRTAKAEGSL